MSSKEFPHRGEGERREANPISLYAGEEIHQYRCCYIPLKSRHSSGGSWHPNNRANTPMSNFQSSSHDHKSYTKGKVIQQMRKAIQEAGFIREKGKAGLAHFQLPLMAQAPEFWTCHSLFVWVLSPESRKGQGPLGSICFIRAFPTSQCETPSSFLLSAPLSPIFSSPHRLNSKPTV